MTKMDLFREIGMIDEKYIIEAESVKRSAIISPVWRRSLATAACFCLCIGLYFGVQRMGALYSDNDAAQKISINEAIPENMTENAGAYEVSEAAETAGTTEEIAELQDKMEQSEFSISESEKGETAEPEKSNVGSMQTTSYDAIGNESQDLSAVKKRFAAYPDDVKELTEEGLVVNLHGELKSGQEKLDGFIKSVEEGKTADIDIVQFTVEGDPIFYYIHYDGADFYAVTDYSRDEFAGSGEKIHEYQYKYLKIFEESIEGGKRVTILLTDEEDLTLEKDLSAGHHSLYIMNYSE